MVSIFVILAIVLLACPAAATIIGPNGRTVFETTATRPSGPQPKRAARSPVLPYNIQQTYKPSSARKPSLKNAWQRLSRPFSMAPQQDQEDHIELTQKQPPLPYNPRLHGQANNNCEDPVSPLSTPSGSSWNTVDRLDHTSDPISPLSVTNLNASSSVAGTIMRGYQSQRQPPAPISHNRAQESFQDIPLTPPTHGVSRKQSLNLGAARGFIPPHVDITNKQQIKEYTKQKGKEVAKQAVAAGANYAANNIKTNIVDANKHNVNNVQLAKPPKAKTNKGTAGWI
ncbi:hypothetical protein LTR70_007819 [Exophiala xenobiotica]|uniref:Secreted protein n=1 Tax=Lithohypha guttulata TaxID=1690604 RepID=A0ABR0K3I2_9EURO|nr:hypothetical protein LTR24_007430 [Lithohypha guttulata]KAK5313064.1 hypothetical protein LTR70_007819 [Exophiala xenobiotica]